MESSFGNVFFAVITIVTALVVGIVGLFFNLRTSQIAAKLEMIEGAIKMQDAGLSIQFHQNSYYKNKCPYEKLASKLIGISCLTNFGNKKLEAAFQECIKEVNNYRYSGMLKGVKDAAIKMKQYNKDLRNNSTKQAAMIAVKLINEDFNKINLIDIDALQRTSDKKFFKNKFNDIINELNTLEIMKFTEIITTFRIQIESAQRAFQTKYSALKEDKFQTFKDLHINLLSQLILSIQKELRTIQNEQSQFIKKESEQTPFGEYYLNFRIQITEFFKRMAGDVDSNFASCSSSQSNSQCRVNISNENTTNGAKTKQSPFEKLTKKARNVENKVREGANRVKNSLYQNIDDDPKTEFNQSNAYQGYEPNNSDHMNHQQQQQYYQFPNGFNQNPSQQQFSPSAPQLPCGSYFNPNLNQHPTYPQYPFPGQTYQFNQGYPPNIDHEQGPPPYTAIHNPYLNY